MAWADGELADFEIDAIRTAVSRSAAEGETADRLSLWLDPGDPPSATELRRLLTAIRRNGEDLDEEPVSLAALGSRIASARGRAVGAAESRALEEMQDALGTEGGEAVRALLSPERAEPDGRTEAAPFDVAGLTALLDGPRAEIRRRVRSLLAGPGFSYRYDMPRSDYREQVLTWCRRLASEGLGALGLPAAHGGGGDPGAFIAAFETLGHHDLSLLTKFGVQFGLFAGSIHQLGTARHHARYLPRAATLELPGCFAMTETGHGSNVSDLRTVARYDREREIFDLHTPDRSAWKDYIGNAARHARLATVFAQLEIGGERYGVHAFLVPVRDEQGGVLPGVSVEDNGPKMGLDGVDNGRLAFDHVEVPRENLLDRFASVDADGSYESPIASPGRRFFTMLGTLVGGRVSVALGSLSVAKSALTIAVRYATRRRQFGPAGEPETLLLDYPSHQRRLLPRLARTYALHFALRDLAEGFVASDAEERREIETAAAGLKALATWHCTDTVQACREACGGQGYLAENRFAALKADSDVFTTFEGDNTVLLQLVSKGLLSGYRKQFGDMSFLDLVRWVGGRAGTAIQELNPLVARETSSEHLRDPEFQIGLLRWREEHLLGTVARRLKKRLDGGMEPTEAFSECQNHLLALARAHVERGIFERASAAIEEAGEAREVLQPVLALYGLDRLEEHSAWLQEHGAFEGGKSRAVRSEVEALCAQLRPAARGLVDAFAIPDALLAAPIAI
ncbi:MAG: acyl-CoA dehydrogenase [Thermoanaerobaculia bacterium]